MRHIALILLLLICFVRNSYCQNNLKSKVLELGKYDTKNSSHNNPYHFEELILYKNGEFDYFLQRNEFAQVKKKGKWSVSGDSLILNEFDPQYKTLMTVNELHDKNIPIGFLKFQVSDYEHNLITYTVSVEHADTTITVRNLNNAALIPMQSADNFSISSDYDYPSYTVKITRNNFFSVKLSPSPSFVEEKWPIVNGKIYPIGTNGLRVGYYLELAH